MCETKTKKRLIGLFLIPLILSIIVSTVTFGGHAAYAVTDPGSGGGVPCTASQTIYYFGNSSKQTIIGEQIGQNPDGSTCSISKTTYQKMAAPPFEYKVGGNNGSCGDTVTLTGGNAADGTYQQYSIPSGSFICKATGSPQSVAVADTEAAALTAATSSGTGTQQQTTDCSIGDGLGWILCPLMRMGAGIADAALGFISGSFLEVNTQLYSTSSATYSAWQWILGFANIFFVIVFLIIIFSQATGFGISNYGIKKMLPKLIIGVVLINLSFFICSIMIDASNLTGYGLNHFFDTLSQGIKLPANSDLSASGSPFTDITVDIIGSLAALAVIVAAIAFFGPVLLAAIVALLMIFLFLIARQAIIILAIIVAPLAFAAWLLPNTEKLFKQWWKIFVDMLLVFPIIGLVFGASKLVSRILTSIYAGNATPAGTPTSIATVASLTTQGQGNIIGQIMAAAVLVVPLFAVPFILKGLLDSVPVAGKWAQRAYGAAVGGTRKQAQKHSDQFLGGFQAQKRAGVRNWWGGGRGAQRDKDGNYLRDAQGRLIGKRGKSLSRTWSQTWGETKKSFDDNKASYEKMADTSYKDRAARRPDTLAGRATRRSEREDVRGAAASSILGAELAHEKGDRSTQVGQWELQRNVNASKQAHAEGKTAKEWEEMQTAPKDPTSAANLQYAKDLEAAGTSRDELVRRAHETALYSQAKNFSVNKRQGDLGEILGRTVDGEGSDADRSLLEIAGGTVDVQSGQKRAQSYAIEAGYKIDDQNVAANRSLISRNMTQAQQRGEDTRKILRDALASNDFYEAAAARDLLFAQGTSGVETFREYFADLEREGHFYEVDANGKSVKDANGKRIAKMKDGVDMGALRTALQRTTIAEHGKTAKDKAKDIVNAFTTGEELDVMANDPKIWRGLNDTELAASSTPFLVRGAINGGIDPKRASAILQDDTLRKQYNDEQREILEILAMGTPEQGREAVSAIWDADTGKRKDNPKRREIDPGDPTDTIGLSNLRAPHYDVPPAGSVTPQFKDYIDSSKGISTMDYDTIIKFQESVANTPVKDDDDDMMNIRNALSLDIERRNNDARIANEKAGKTIYAQIPNLLSSAPSRTSSQPANADQATYTVNRAGDVSPNRGETTPTPTTAPQSFARKISEAARVYNFGDLSQMGLSYEDVQKVNNDPVRQNRLTTVLDDFTSARGRVINNDPQQINNLRSQLIQAVRRVVDEE